MLEALNKTRRDAGAQAQRVRLTLAKSGAITVRSVPLLPPAAEMLTVAIADETVDSRNPFLRHKTTVRAQYNDALKRIEALPSCFDLLFFNERGELTEGARTNVYVVRDGRWYTPPLECGVLNGVMRRALMATHEPRIEERTLLREDLESADELYLSNAARGLFRVRLADVDLSNRKETERQEK